MAPLLNERTRRLWAAAESVAIGVGGDAVVSASTGLARKTLRDGRLELAQGLTATDRIRRPGAGRPDIEQTQPGVPEALDSRAPRFLWTVFCEKENELCPKENSTRLGPRREPGGRPERCGWRIGKNSRVVRCARRPEPESSAKTAFVRCTIEAVPSVSQGGRAIGVERWRVLSNQIFSRFRRQAAIGV